MLSFNLQILGNVNVTRATSTSFQIGFKNTVANLLNVSNETVTITSIVATQSARRLLAAGVQINYNLKSSSALNQIENALNDAISSGAFGNRLRRNTGGTVVASATIDVVDITPTSMPTPSPSVVTESEDKDENELKLGSTAITLIAILGFFGVLCGVLGLTYCCYNMRKRKGSSITTIVVTVCM